MLVRARGIALALLVAGASLHLASSHVAGGVDGPAASAPAPEVDEGVDVMAKWWK